MEHRSLHSLMLLVVALTFTVFGNNTVNAQDTGKVLADIGFRPAVDGFSFQNYANDGVQNLTPVEMTA